MDLFLRYTREFEDRIGLRAGFFNELIKEDDWSFVIKLHAFIEGCLTNAICSVLGRPELEDVIARLDTSNNQSGKLAFIKRLEMLNKPQRRFIATLSDLRNDLVHNARSIDFSFERHMGEMTEERRFQFCVALSLHELFAQESELEELRLISFVNEVPKLGIGWAASIVVSDLFIHANAGDLDIELKRVGKRIIDSMMQKGNRDAAL